MRVLADSWYGEALGYETLQTVVPRRWRGLLRSGPFRGAALWWYGRRYQAVLTAAAGSATRTLLAIEWLTGRRRRYLILLEFIPVLGSTSRTSWGSPAGLRGGLGDLYWRVVAGPVLRSSLLFAHTLTSWEAKENAERFSLEADRVRFVPFFGSAGEAESSRRPDGGQGGHGGVVASGHAACDWQTVFAAADGEQWPLTVICGSPDLADVEKLNADGRARVFCAISSEAHASLLRECDVYLLALREAGVSSGHVRLHDASAAGLPVVASAVRSLEGYVRDGVNALTFAPGDALSARAAINRLCDDAGLRARLVKGAREQAQGWQRADYLSAIHENVVDAIASVS